MTHHITDEQIFAVADEHADGGHGPVGEPANWYGFEQKSLLEFTRAALALAAPQGEPAISMKHGPWLQSEYDENETYCQRCKTRSIFAADRQCDPHIVYTAPAPTPATQDQPAPVPNDERPAWELVIEDMKARDNLGRARYGTPLQPNNGRNNLVDAYQEVLDLAVYLRCELEARKD